MKTYQFIIILVLLSICATQVTAVDTCPAYFNDNLNDKCKEIGDCVRDDYGCFRRGCGSAKDSTSCYKTVPNGAGVDIHKIKCYWTGTECKTTEKTCTDYNKLGNKFIDNLNDKCSDLKTDDNTLYTCVLESDKENGCKQHYKDCSKVPQTQCYNRNDLFLKDFSVKCDWDSTLTTPTCVADNSKRSCLSINYYASRNGYDLSLNNENKCIDLVTDDIDKKKCIYFNGQCRQEYIRCDLYTSEIDCKTFDLSNNPDNLRYYNMPLNQNDYDYSKKCVWNKNAGISGACESADTICSDYNRNQMMCEKLTNCAYDSDTNKCIEKYNDCQSFSNKETEKDREKCENSFLSTINNKCDYILGTDECKLKKTYSTCGDYNNEVGEDGHKDKVICESIRTSNPPYYCVLDKDNQCIERVLNCSEAYDEEDCLHIAKSSDPNKKCAFKSDKCVEEFIRCEDFIEPTEYTTSCNDIKLYNGLKCKYESDKCRSEYKKCSEAKTKEECKLIAKTGVSDPDRKVCDYIGYDSNSDGINDVFSCEEVFKYCSDYRGEESDVCEKIKPYDKNGEKIDELFKCVMENKKCQKVPKDCKDADDNPILCSKISPFIKDNSTKYCRYDKFDKDNNEKNKCREDYKTCESYKEVSTNDYDENYNTKEDTCTKIIPEDYLQGSCLYKKDNTDDIYKCVADDECRTFNDKIDNYRELCNKHTDPECLYDSNSETCEEIERSCDEIRFDTEENAKEEYCNGIDASKPYKICSLKEDKSGCEEIYRELDFSTASSSYKNPPGSESQESSEMVGGIQLIMILLCLLS